MTPTQPQPDEGAVRVALKQILSQADLETTTERGLKRALEDQFKCAMSPFASVIHEEVERFINGSAAGQMDDAASGAHKRGREGAPAEAPAPQLPRHTSDVAAARAAAAAAAGAVQRAKEGGDALDVTLSVDGLLRCRVREFKGRHYVDIRTHYRSGEELKPSPRGLMLQASEWATLSAQLQVFIAAVQAADTSFQLALTGERRATVSDFSGNAKGDLREWYGGGDGGELKPGKKGTALPLDALKILDEAAPNIDATLRALQTHSGAPPAAAANGSVAAAAKPLEQPAERSNTAATGAGAAHAPGAQREGAGGAGGAVDMLVNAAGDRLWRLAGAGTKFAAVSDFNGRPLFNLREYYQKGDNWCPGKKGISLSREQFDTLAQSAQDITAAVQAHNTSFELALSSLRKVTLGEFKGRLLVNVREYYEKGGSLNPTQKGLAMNSGEWATLVAVLPSMRTAAG